MPVDYATTNTNEYTFASECVFYTTNWTYPPNYEPTPEDIDRLVRISRASPTNDIYSETAITYPTVEPQEEEFDTTEIKKYIDSLEKEVVGTEN